MKNLLVLSVTCLNDYADDGIPSVAVVEITRQYIERIRVLRDALISTGADRIAEFDFSPNWYQTTPDELEDGEEVSLAETEALFETMDTLSVEASMLVVTSDGKLFFTAYPKHGSAQEGLRTATASISDLEDNDLIISLN